MIAEINSWDKALNPNWLCVTWFRIVVSTMILSRNINFLPKKRASILAQEHKDEENHLKVIVKMPESTSRNDAHGIPEPH